MFYSGNNSKTKIIYTLILMYHRIENLENGPEGISVRNYNLNEFQNYLNKINMSNHQVTNYCISQDISL